MNALKEIVRFVYLKDIILAKVGDGVTRNNTVAEIRWNITDDGICVIHGLYVLDSWRRKGIARMLNQQLFKYIEFDKIDFFVTRASNPYIKHMLEEEFGFNAHPVYPNILVKML